MYGAIHRGTAKALVHSLKYEGRKALGRRMGQALARKTVFPAGIDFLLPVPLHKKSERPYNQALEIARGISDIWKLPVLDVLQWAREGKRQVEKSAVERKNLPEGAVAFSGKQSDLSGKRALLVDDVSTTGTTLRRCVDAISQSGVDVRGAVVWTRVPQKE
ncbi:MAG: ComF family protein [Thermovirgaceae bacterium]